VQSLPLACMDSQTLHDAKNDLRVLEIHYQDRIGENFLVCPSNKHRWIYYPEMTYNEALLIKQWDSAGDLALKDDRDDDDDNNRISTFSIHSAFLDPCSPLTSAPPRQSIEVRCVAVWNPKDEQEY
jgi:hypothetical protein